MSAQAGHHGLFSRLIHRAVCSRYSFLWFALISFLENTVVFIAIEPFVIPLMAVHHARTFFIATALLTGSIAGAIAAYFFGYFLFDTVGGGLISWLGVGEAYEEALARISEHGFAALFIIGVTPVPFQLGTLAAGVTGYSMPLFLLSVCLARSLRYYALALVVKWLGKGAEAWIGRHKVAFVVASFALIALFIAGFTLWDSGA